MPQTVSPTEDTAPQRSLVTILRNKATGLRIESIRATTEAGSGHPTSCCSAADIVATLFFGVMRYDARDCGHPANDRFVLSKGHAAPLLYAAWAEAGLFPKAELLKLRRLDSDLEGHPTPRLPFVQVATGSLGQGLPAGVGLAYHAKHLAGLPYRTYVLMGDGESIEGSVWEAAELAHAYGLDNLCAVVDANRLGQSDPTIHQHRMEAYRDRWSAFGWHAMIVDGHDLSALLKAFEEAASTKGRPAVVLAKTFKGRGVSFLEDQPNWHGKPLPKGDTVQKALDELREQLDVGGQEPEIRKPDPITAPQPSVRPMPVPGYERSDKVATRQAFGDALVALGDANSLVVVLDADVKNSTFTDQFARKYPERFIECYIAEQNMVGMAAGLASCGRIPFVATFACFLTRAYDFIRMAAISRSNMKLMGSHAGVSIGEDGPSQMGLEDIAMMAAQPDAVVLYPSDAVSSYALVQQAANHRGLVYIRTSRPKTPILYDNDEAFPIGGCKILRQSESDRLTIVAAGVTVFEALNAYEELKAGGGTVRVIDLYSIVPVDQRTLIQCARETRDCLLTVEDHYERGGVGDAVLRAVAGEGIQTHKLAVKEIPRSGSPEELLDRYGISARAIVETVRRLC